MQQYTTQILQCSLFERIPEKDLLRSLNCLCAQVLHYQKDNIILHQGVPAKFFGVILSGCVHITSSDAYGNHTLITELQKGDLFGETFACAGLSAIPASVTAASDCIILLLEHARVIAGCQNGCMAHSMLVTNLMRSLAQKNLQLTQKLGILSRRSIHNKLSAYLLLQQKNAGSSRFTIPYDRQQLADYLCIDRSAMSAELSKMKKAGLIACRKNEFEILSLNHEDMPASRQT